MKSNSTVIEDRAFRSPPGSMNTAEKLPSFGTQTGKVM